jgi:PAS domain S-box-containing protein
MDRRLTALHATGLLDSRREGRFDRLTRVVAAALGVPVSLIALVDVDRQFFKSAVGLTPAIDERRQTPLSHSFCRHVVESESPLIVNDSATNALVADNPAIDALGVAAYLGVPIADGDGVVIGSLCAIEHQPRAWTAADIDILKDVAALVEREIADRQASDAMAETERTIRHILNTMPHLVFATDAAGRPDGYNSQWHAFTGNAADDSDARGWAFFCHPDDQPAALAAWEDSLKTHAPFEAECRLRRHDGTYRWMLARAQPVRDSHGAIERWFGSCTDIQAVRDIAEANDMMKRELAGGLIDRLSDKAAYAEGREFEEIRSLIRALRELGVGE